MTSSQVQWPSNETVGKVAFHKLALNKINQLRVEKQPKSGFSYRLVRGTGVALIHTIILRFYHILLY
jgi:hypothetical protein